MAAHRKSDLRIEMIGGTFECEFGTESNERDESQFRYRADGDVTLVKGTRADRLTDRMIRQRWNDEHGYWRTEDR